MKGKVLFVYPTSGLIKTGSGEVEARILRTGFQLMGYEVDVLGFDVSRILDYELFIVFTLSDAICTFVENLPPCAKVIIIPYCDDCINFGINARQILAKKNVAVYSRSKSELDRLSHLISKNRLIDGVQWFLIPFINDLVDEDCTEEFNLDSINMMAEPKRSSGVMKLVSLGFDVHVYTESEKPDWCDSSTNLKVNRRLVYGSEGWMRVLCDSKEFYEPNSRVTASMLERLYLKKTVIVQSENPIIDDFNESSVIEQFVEGYVSIRAKDDRFLMAYHADNVARLMIKNAPKL